MAEHQTTMDDIEPCFACGSLPCDRVNDPERLHNAVKNLIAWRRSVNDHGEQLMSNLDHEGIIVALFNGPIWDELEDALNV